MDWGTLLSDPEAVGPLIPIVLIVTIAIATIAITIAKRTMTHRERMAMIEQGLHPDHPPEEVEASELADRLEQAESY